MAQIQIQRVPESSDRSLPVFSEFERIADRIRLEAYNLFAHRGAGEGHALDDWLAAERKLCWPAAELAEEDDRYEFKVALAGFDPKEITVTATPNEIVVKAAHERTESGSDDEAKLKWSEFRSNDVFRRVELPKAVAVNKISANLKNGLLEITAPKDDTGAKEAKKVELSTPS